MFFPVRRPMFSARRWDLLILPAVLLLLAAACGDDPTPSPTSAPPPEPATATPTPTPTPTPEPQLAQESDGTYVLRDFVVEDGKFELRMGETAYWGYGADERPITVHGLVEIVIGPIQVGETVIFSSCRQSGDRSTKAHHMTVEGIGVDHNLDDVYGTGGAVVGDSGDPANNCEFTFDAPGEYVIDDSTDPGEHGVAKFIVEGGGGDAVAAGPSTYTMEEFSVEDGKFEFRPAAAAPAWGYQDGDQILSDVNEIVITVNLGDRIVLEDGFHSSGSRASGPHFFTITELGIDVELPQGLREVMPGFTIEATMLGEFIMHCSLHPDGHGIPMKLIVLDGGATRPAGGGGAADGGGGAAAAGPGTFIMEEFSVEDGKFELRPAAAAAAWGYQDGDQILSDVNEIVITVNLGDRIVLEDGFHSSGSRSSGPHFFTITELGIDVELPQGLREVMPGFTIEATVAGEFIMHCSLHPDGHGIPMKLIVLDGGATPPAGGGGAADGGGGAAAAGPGTFIMEEFSVEDGKFELRPAAAAAAWGYQDGDQILSDVNEIVITVNLGDRIVLEDGFHSSGSRSSGPHFFTITELGIDVELPQGLREVMPGFTIEATVAGEFIMHCSLHPDGHGIPMKLIVLDGGG